MIVSLANVTMVSPQPQLGGAAKAAVPVFARRLNYSTKTTSVNRRVHFPVPFPNGCLGIMCSDGGCRFFSVRFAHGCSKRRAYPVADYDGLWEDPDDVSDDSEYEDEDEGEDEEMEDNDKDVAGKGMEISTQKYEEDLVKEVEQLLTPEERAILEQNEAPDLDKLSTAKWKPLHTFALAGHIKFMDGLLEKGCNIDMVDKDGSTALHLAVIGKREAVISHLLRKGANPEAKDQDGATPLHYAAQVGALQTVKLLIKYKVDVNVADNEGWTPLHVAMQTRNRDIAKILLVNGADKTRRNKDGNTALDLSLCYGRDFKSYELAKLVKQVSATRGL